MKVAIVGSGIAGLSAAHTLVRAGHATTLFEAEPVVGGHVKTVEVETDAGAIGVDTGFIVYNTRTYPRFVALLDELGVPTQPSDMSLGGTCGACDLEWSTRGVRGYFGPNSSIVSPSHWGMLADLHRFYREARERLDRGASANDETLADFLERGRYRNAFRNHFLVPLTSAVWSTAANRIGEFPIDYLLGFLDHHGLIGFGRTVQWRTVTGGSMRYVEHILAGLPRDAVRTGDAVVDVRRGLASVTLRTASGWSDIFEAVVLATHADDALRLLHDADPRERAALDGFDYTTNDVVLHTDTSFLPRRHAARASWNVDQADCRIAGERLTMTYHMNRLQALEGPTTWCTSVNPNRDRLDPATIVAERQMRHPLYTFRTLRAQHLLAGVQGRRRTWYAGAHLGYGFHEDGCRAGMEAADAIAAFARGDEARAA